MIETVKLPVLPLDDAVLLPEMVVPVPLAPTVSEVWLRLLEEYGL